MTTTLDQVKSALEPEFPQGHFDLSPPKHSRSAQLLDIVFDEVDFFLSLECRVDKDGPIKLNDCSSTQVTPPPGKPSKETAESVEEACGWVREKIKQYGAADP